MATKTLQSYWLEKPDTEFEGKTAAEKVKGENPRKSAIGQEPNSVYRLAQISHPWNTPSVYWADSKQPHLS